MMIYIRIEHIYWFCSIVANNYLKGLSISIVTCQLFCLLVINHRCVIPLFLLAFMFYLCTLLFLLLSRSLVRFLNDLFRSFLCGLRLLFEPFILKLMLAFTLSILFFFFLHCC